MSLATLMYQTLSPVLGGRVSPDRTPDDPVFPLATWQRVGGMASAYADRSLPGAQHARVQVNVWSRTRLEADDLCRQVAVALVGQTDACVPTGAPVALYDDVLDLYGSRQIFGLWFTD